MNEGWSWATAILAASGCGCLLLAVMLLAFLGALFIEVAYTLSRSR